MNRISITAACELDQDGRALCPQERDAALRVVRESLDKWFGRFEESRGRIGAMGREGESVTWTAYVDGSPMAARVIAQQAATALRQRDVVLAISSCTLLERVEPEPMPPARHSWSPVAELA